MHEHEEYTNLKVNIMRLIALSFKDEDIYIPDNDKGIKEGYYKTKSLVYFLADMIEE